MFVFYAYELLILYGIIINLIKSILGKNFLQCIILFNSLKVCDRKVWMFYVENNVLHY